MPQLRFRLFAALTVVSAFATPLSAQRVQSSIRDSSTRLSGTRPGVIEGVVTDTGLVPIQAAEVRVLGTDSRLFTGPNGRFRFTGIPPKHEILVMARRIGFTPTYTTLSVESLDTTRVTLALDRLPPTSLDTVRVRANRITGALADFETRRQRGFGYYLSTDQLRSSRTTETMNYLRRMPAVRLVYDEKSNGYVAEGLRIQSTIMAEEKACNMQVILDGMIMPKTFTLDLLPRPDELFGIEVYQNQTGVPPTYQSLAKCGIIFVWTKYAQ